MSYVASQPLVFFACLGAGAFSALFYALLWLLRQAIKSRPFTLIADILFVTTGSAAYFLCLFATNCGEFRLFSIAAFAGGFALLYYLLKPLRPKVMAFAKRVKSKTASLRKRKKTKPT